MYAIRIPIPNAIKSEPNGNRRFFLHPQPLMNIPTHPRDSLEYYLLPIYANHRFWLQPHKKTASAPIRNTRHLLYSYYNFILFTSAGRTEPLTLWVFPSFVTEIVYFCKTSSSSALFTFITSSTTPPSA